MSNFVNSFLTLCGLAIEIGNFLIFPVQITCIVKMSDNPADDFKEQLNELQEKANDATKFLVVDVAKAQDELARNWGWITASGISTMVLGGLALGLPVFATGVAYDGTVLALGATGLVSLFGALARENGHKVKSALSGVLYVALAYYMSTHPAQGLDVITLTIATAIAAEGLYETALAVRNEDLQGRGWHLVSGIGSTAAGVWLTANIPAASLFAPGAALGTRLTTNGATKVAVGLAGKELADKQK